MEPEQHWIIFLKVNTQKHLRYNASQFIFTKQLTLIFWVTLLCHNSDQNFLSQFFVVKAVFLKNDRKIIVISFVNMTSEEMAIMRRYLTLSNLV